MLSAKLLKDGSVKISILQFAGSYPQSQVILMIHLYSVRISVVTFSCLLISSILPYFFLNLLFSSLFLFFVPDFVWITCVYSMYSIHVHVCTLHMIVIVIASGTYFLVLLLFLHVHVVLELNSVINRCEL